MPLTNRQCCVRGCTSLDYPGCGLSFHLIPQDKLLKQKWQEVLQVDISGSTFVCNRHFRPSDITIHRRFCILKPGVVPSLLLDTSAPDYEDEKSSDIKSDSLADDYIDDTPLSHLPTIPISEITNDETQEIKRDPLEFDYDFEDAIPASQLLPNSDEETLSIKSELESDLDISDTQLSQPYVPVINNQQNPSTTPLSRQRPINQPSVSVPATKQGPTMIIGPLLSRPKLPSVNNADNNRQLPSVPASASVQRNPTLILCRSMPPSHLSSEPKLQVPAPAVVHRELPRMLIGPLPSSHLTPVNTVHTNTQQNPSTTPTSRQRPINRPSVTKPVNSGSETRERVKELSEKVTALVNRLKERDEKIKHLETEVPDPREDTVSIATQQKIEELTQEITILWRRLRNRDLKIKHLNAKILSLKKQNAKRR